MKLRYLLTTFAAAAALAVGCTVNPVVEDNSEIQLENSYRTIPEKGGDITVAFTAVDNWMLNEKSLPEWLSAKPLSGPAGDAEIVFSAEAAKTDRDITVQILCAGKTQYVKITQMGDPALKPEFDEFKEGDYWMMFEVSEDAWQVAKPVGASSSYGYLYAQDAVVGPEGELSSIAANVFTFKAVNGGFTIQDPSGRYYYMTGTYTSFNVTDTPTEGHVWTVEQTAETEFVVTNKSNSKYVQFSTGYSSAGVYDSPQNGGVLPNLVKAEEPAPELIVVDQKEWNVGKEEGVLNVPATVNSSSLYVEDDAAWLSYNGVKVVEGVSTLEFSYLANDGAPRAAAVTVSATDGTVTTVVNLTVNQEGLVEIIDATAAEINSGVDDQKYRITGYISKEENSTYGNIYVTDHTGTVYVRGVLDADGNSKNYASLGIKEGDIVTVVGPKSTYNSKAQLNNVSVEKHDAVTDVTVAEFLSKENSKEVYYRLSGEVTSIADPSKGNFNIKDATGEVYVYSCKNGWGGDRSEWAGLGIKVGDVVTIVGQRAEYNGNAQVGNYTFYVSHESAGETPEPADVTIVMSEIFSADTELEDGKTYTWNGINVTYTRNSSSGSSKYVLSDGGLRLYQSDVLTFDAGDKTIAKVAFTPYGGKNGPLAADTGEMDTDGLVWTGESAKIAFTASKQLRFKQVEITYKK